jgi:hypothetical protein
MLSQANISVVDTLRSFKSVGVPVSFLVPTKTGLEKSIMDATKSIRDFFKEQNLHDYSKQEKGSDFKVLIPTLLVSNESIIETKTSLYRPETKNGDPRIWIYKLVENAEPTDLIALTVNSNGLVAVNCSKSLLSSLLNVSSLSFSRLFSTSVVGLSHDANQLLAMMREIASKGYVKTLRSGDTGVGFTLESLLGISANSSKAPDFRGIEIKSGRKKSQRSGRTTIFSQVPSWGMSRLKSSKEILFERGRFHEVKKRMQLFHEFSAVKLSSYDMKLVVDHTKDQLHQVYVENGFSTVDAIWEFDVLKGRILEKHKETFWVSAQTKGRSGDQDEEFWYSDVKHTGSVDASVFPTLIETGVVTLDYTIKESKPNVAKDQGYLFKISSSNLDLLFSRVDHYSLI